MQPPLATYRLQLNKHFTFSSVEAILPYLKKLGIRSIYLSPILQACPGSLHGYDVCNFTKINQELGTYNNFMRLANKVKSLGMTICLDIVPNHMSTSKHNPFWQRVIRTHADKEKLFDIDWQKSNHSTMSYRRFFDINELVCLHVEDDAIFKKIHKLIFKLINENYIQGLRIDHIDGLREPTHYLQMLQKSIGKPFYIIVEKILGFNENTPSNWPISGTTGYDFLNHCNQLFIDPLGLAFIINQYQEITGEAHSSKELLIQKKDLIIDKLFKKEFDSLCSSMQKIIKKNHIEIAYLCRQFAVRLPVYRTYFETDYEDDEGRKIIENISLEIETDQEDLLQKIKQVICREIPKNCTKIQKNLRKKWVSDWQVFTGPLMAKGFEDTLCYSYYPLLSLNEVGSSPEYFSNSGSIAALHQFNLNRSKRLPDSLNATSTHDTKRSEDARARLNVLSEIAIEWTKFLKKWVLKNQNKKTKINLILAPDSVDEIMIYQTLLSIWPFDNNIVSLNERMANYLIKAVRERKTHSSWYNPQENYENAVKNFYLFLTKDALFLKDFIKITEKISFYGAYNALTQLLLKITSPGIPDFYQGSETWYFHLVDPDNRNPIDYSKIPPLSNTLLQESLAVWKTGQIKVDFTAKLLMLRAKYPQHFLEGKYLAINCSGKLAHHVVAFAKIYKNLAILIVSLRWFTKLISFKENWNSNGFTSESISLPFSYYKIYDLLQDKQLPLRGSLTIKHLIAELPFAVIGLHLC